MESVCSIAKELNLYVIEDCAEGLGSSLGGKPAGSFGDASIFSFFGNKTITTGEGGMVVLGIVKMQIMHAFFGIMACVRKDTGITTLAITTA